MSASLDPRPWLRTVEELAEIERDLHATPAAFEGAPQTAAFRRTQLELRREVTAATLQRLRTQLEQDGMSADELTRLAAERLARP